MAIIDKKQTRWYSKSTFDSLDKTTIPVGTEIQVGGELEQADFDSDTNTKLNAVPNKLDKPSGNPTEDSLVKVSSTGSVAYTALSTLGKTSLTYHKITIYYNSLNYYLGIISTKSTSYTTVNEIFTDFNNRKIVSVYYPDMITQTPTINASISFPGEYDTLRIIWIDANTLAISHLDIPFGSITSFSDEVTLL